jgi:two-component system phosphate regulon sensor histidine kinase PhoR
MFKKYDNRPLFILVGVVILGLIAVQAYWIMRSVTMQKIATERLLKEDMDAVLKEVEDNAYCFGFFSKAFLKDEGIYIIRQKFTDGRFRGPKEGGYIDTLDLYNVFYDDKDTSFYKDRSVSFSKYAATVDVTLKFSFTGMNPKIKRNDTGAYNLSGLSENNYKELLANKFTIDEAIDVVLLDKLIKDALKKHKLDTLYSAGIRKQGDKKFEYLVPGSDMSCLASSGIKSLFLENKFDRPYELVIAIPQSFMRILATISAMMVSSGIVILLLIFCYAYFVKTILAQKRLSEMKNTFINNITHEFRTPITNINLALENWKDSSGDTGIIAEENAHLEQNVEQILNLTTFEHGNIQANFVKVDLRQVIHETVNSFNIQMDKLKGRVIYHLDVQDAIVDGDAHHLKTMFYNLIDNAIKYRNTAPEISISVKEQTDSLQIEVEDNGIGMSAETMKHIFDRFYRGYTGDKHDVKGFGLGLSYVKYIVTLHKGAIKVRSKLGQGSIFTIILPRNH